MDLDLRDMRKAHLSVDGITVDWDGALLSLETAGLRRVVAFPYGAPCTVSLRTPDGRERAKREDAPELSLCGLIPAEPGVEWQWGSVTLRRRRADVLYPARVEAEVLMRDPVRRADYRRVYLLFPGLPVIGVKNFVRSEVSSALYPSPRMRAANGADPAKLESVGDALTLRFPTRKTGVVTYGRTDYSDLRCEEFPVDSATCRANILYADFRDGSGIGFLQEAPPSDERRDFAEHDFRFAGERIVSCAWGAEPAALRPGVWVRGQVNYLFGYANPGERSRIIKRLRAYLDQLPNAPVILVNPWGCGRYYEVVDEAFTLRELDAASEIGATHYQIDDGWQRFGRLPDLSRRNRALDAATDWTVARERFGGTLERVAERARKRGVDIGLWLAPSFNREYRDWRQMLEVVLGMYHDYGICRFKIDAVRLRTAEAEANLRAFFTAARRRSRGRIVFDLDITNGQRSGLCMFGEYGSVFMENRYATYDGVVAYHPELLLRNLWKIGRHLPLNRLEIEVPYPGDANAEYRKNNASALAYPLEYWALLAFPCEPLWWFAPSLVDPDSRRRLKRLAELFRRLRGHVPAPETHALGQLPDGGAFCAFRLYDFSLRRGAWLCFREARCADREAEFACAIAPAGAAPTVVFGAGAAERTAAGALRVTVPDAPGAL
ncbi:MAG: alpha-galactosidase, partial [Lentisphaeria bacterium]|nr:alpha-galactosidase [Lentisphaeria bacterium]